MKQIQSILITCCHLYHTCLEISKQSSRTSENTQVLFDVKNGRIGLPDLQRPFVWKDNKVRELLDSMMKGYPIGYIMLWPSPDVYDNTGYIGKNDKMYKRPDDLVIDGQQRLTALLAAMYGVTIKDKNYKERKIRIFFNPQHYLEEIGYDNNRDRNQIANFTYLDYATNIDISDAPPAEYVGRYRDKLGEDGYKLACAQNALPENFEQLAYPDFLNQRRLLMAQIVKKAYNELDK